LNLLSAVTLNPSVGSWERNEGAGQECWTLVDGTKKAVCKKLKTKWNNVIKVIKTRFQGKLNGGWLAVVVVTFF
jgi:hypothetical protein